MSSNISYNSEINIQKTKNKSATNLIKLVTDLWYDDTIELLLFRNQLIDQNVSEILHVMESARKFTGVEITIEDILNTAEIISSLDLKPARIDIGKLTYESTTVVDKKAFIIEKFSKIKIKDIEPKDVVLYGFGRIGRLLARELMIQTGAGNQLRLRAVVTRGELTKTVLEKRASLLRDDSVHDDFHGSVAIDIENKALIINGITVHMISSNAPDTIDYTKYDINDALVIDNTGVWRDDKGLALHLKSKGVAKVLLTAPAKGDVPNIVYGVNQNDFNVDKYDIFSAASCTTNAITPILKILEDTYGIQQGHLETIHSYTNDQNLVDNFHKKYRRGRAAAVNMVITTTGAGAAVSKAVPSLEGLLTSSAIRVPVPNGSLAILNLQLKESVSLEALNTTIKKHALDGELVEQIKYSMNNELVSSDIIGTAAACIYDSMATKISERDNKVILYLWYDNEYGYAHQVIRLAKHIGKVRRFTYY